MAVLLHHAEVADVERVVERLKFSRAEMHHVVALVENLPRFSEIRQMRASTLKRFFRLGRFEDHLELARIHRVAAGEDLADYAYARRKREEWTEREIWPEPVVTGDDLIAMGYAPGPHFKEILTRLEDEQLEGRIRNRDDAIDFIKRHWSI